MDIKNQTNTLRIITRLINNKKDNKSVIDFTPQKTEIFGKRTSTRMPRSTPRKEGVSSERINEYFKALTENHNVFPHGVIIVKNGKIIAEKEYSPYNNNIWHITYSMCKTITGMAIGMLCDYGILSVEDRVCEIMGDQLPLLTNVRLKKLTVKDLLTMSSGVVFNETGVITEENWTEGFFTSGVKFIPGSSFNYNSMNTYILSVIVKKVTGEGLCEFLEPRLFEPLGIRDYFWEKSQQGIEKGGWGLYLLPEDMAKLGQLILNGGKWGDHTLLSDKWMREAESKQIEVPESIGRYGYGYQMWIGEDPRCILFNGMFGQNISVFPDINTVVVATAGNSDMFQTNDYFELTDKYIGRGFDVPVDLPEKSATQLFVEESVEKALRRSVHKEAMPQLCEVLNGSMYKFEKRESSPVSLLPLILQTLQNNFQGGLSRMAFIINDGKFKLIVKENSGVHVIPVGFLKPEHTVLNFGGEKYMVAVTGHTSDDEDGYPVLSVKMSFIETASVREMKFYLKSDSESELVWRETPGVEFIVNGAGAIYSSIENKIKIVKKVADILDWDIMLYQLNRILAPRLIGVKNHDLGELINILKIRTPENERIEGSDENND